MHQLALARIWDAMPAWVKVTRNKAVLVENSLVQKGSDIQGRIRSLSLHESANKVMLIYVDLENKEHVKQHINII